MRRRWKILVALVVLATAGAAAALLRRTPEPSYQGVSLSQWLDIAHTNNLAVAPLTIEREAVRHIGTNAIPLLMQWISSNPQPLHGPLVFLRDHSALPPFLGNAAKAHQQRAVRNIQRARYGFYLLGPEAAPAVPQLTRKIMADPEGLRGEYLYVLCSIGEPAVPALVNMTAISRGDLCVQAIRTLGQMGTNATAAIPTLQRLAFPTPFITSGDPFVISGEAERALEKIAPDTLTNSPAH